MLNWISRAARLWATGRAEQGNLKHWPESRREIADSLRRIVQVLANARTADAKYVDGEQGWKMLIEDLHPGRLSLEPPEGLFDHLENEGVLFLNTSLTVSVDVSRTPKRVQGNFQIWEPLLRRLLTFLATRGRIPVVFLLWGKHAISVFEHGEIRAAAESAGTWQSTVDIARHVHPAAITREGAAFLRRPNPLVSANQVLKRMGGMPIAW